MIFPFWAPMAVKAVTTALVVVTASVLAEAFGPLWGALIATLPVSSGPAYVFLAMQHDQEFIQASALSSFAANPATALYLVVYARLARNRSLLVSLGSALAAWFACALFVLQFTWTPFTACVLNAAVYGAGYLILRVVLATPTPPPTPRIRHWSEVPMRAIAVATFVTVVVLSSSSLGPEATGIAAVFPVTFTSLLVILNPRIGGQSTAALAANALQAMVGFGLMLLTLHVAIEPWGIPLAMVASLLVAVGWSLGLLAVKGKLRRS